MQKAWQKDAEIWPITQVTSPHLVHEFIESHPGLAETCHDNVQYLISYAPQLVIRGFCGQFEPAIDDAYQHSVQLGEARRAANHRHGSALTVDGRSPTCDEKFALRHPDFGSYEPPTLACQFVQGDINGPEVRFYEHIDYTAWFLSDKSRWLPTDIRAMLTKGIAGWGVWLWHAHDRRSAQDFGFQEEPFTGTFADSLQSAQRRSTFRPSRKARQDLKHRLSFSARLLDLPESGDALAELLIGPDFLDAYFAYHTRRQAIRSKK